jgi:hypothetical protein
MRSQNQKASRAFFREAFNISGNFLLLNFNLSLP